MRVGFKLFSGYVLILFFMGLLVMVGIDGERTLSRHYDSLVRVTRLEKSISLVHQASLAGADKKVLLSLCNDLLNDIGAFDVSGTSNEAAIIRRAQLAAQGYKEQLEKWCSARDDLSRYLGTAKDYAKSLAADAGRIATLLSLNSSINQDAAGQEKYTQRVALLTTVQENAKQLQVALKIMEATARRGEYEHARSNAEGILKAVVALRASTKGIDSMVLDRSVVSAKRLDADMLQLGMTFNGLQEAEQAVSFGLSNTNIAIRQYADTQRDGLATVRESAIIPSIAVIAGAVIVAVLFGVLLTGMVGRFVTTVAALLERIVAGENFSLNDADTLPPELTRSFQELWSAESLQLAALSRLAEGHGLVEAEKPLAATALGRAIIAVAYQQQRFSTNLAAAATALDIEAPETVAEQLEIVSGKAQTLATSLAQVQETAQAAVAAAEVCKNDISMFFENAVEELTGVCDDATVQQLSDAVSQPAEKNMRDVPVSIARVRAHFTEVERAVKILGWQVSSYEDFARQLETLAINVNVEAARVGAGTSAMSTIVDELRLVAEKCRKASEASEKGKTVGIRSLEAVFSDLRQFEGSAGQTQSAEKEQVIAYASAICERIRTAEGTLNELCSSSLDVITAFTDEAEKIISAVETTVDTTQHGNDAGGALEFPITLTSKVTDIDTRIVELPALDL